VANPKRSGRDLIVEWLGAEALVYDPDSQRGHVLNGPAAAALRAAPDEISRRQVLRKAAAAGVTAAGAAAVMRTIVAPTPAQAQSLGNDCGANGACGTPLTCCGASGGSSTSGICCVAGQCCSNGTQFTCFIVSCQTTCAGTFTNGVCS
jgi:hypothetical protein